MFEEYNKFKESLYSMGVYIDNDRIIVDEKDDIFIILSRLKNLYDNNETIYVANQIANNLMSKPIYKRTHMYGQEVEHAEEWQNMFRDKLSGYRHFEALDSMFMESIDWNNLGISNSLNVPSSTYKRPTPNVMNLGRPSIGDEVGIGDMPKIPEVKPVIINETPILVGAEDNVSEDEVLALYDDPLALNKPEWDVNASNDNKSFIKSDDALDTLFLRVLFDALTGPKWLVKIADESTGEFHFLVSDSINRKELCLIEIAVEHPHGNMKIDEIYKFNKCARRVDDGVKFFASDEYESWHNILNDTPSNLSFDSVIQYGDEGMFKEFCRYVMNTNGPVDESTSNEVSGEHVLTKTIITALHKLALFVNKYPNTFKDLIVNDKLLPYTLVLDDPSGRKIRLLVPRYDMKNDEWLFWDAGYMYNGSPMFNPMIYDTYLNVRMSHFEYDVHYLGFKMIEGNECDFLSTDTIIEHADSAKDLADAIPHLFSEVK